MSEILKKKSKNRVSGVDRFLNFIRVVMATLIVVGASRAFLESESSFNKGTAHVLFPSGTSLILTNTGGYTRTYFVEGYIR